jgi:nucleoside 2-deoxyribosyltransferase
MTSKLTVPASDGQFAVIRSTFDASRFEAVEIARRTSHNVWVLQIIRESPLTWSNRERPRRFPSDIVIAECPDFETARLRAAAANDVAASLGNLIDEASDRLWQLKQRLATETIAATQGTAPASSPVPRTRAGAPRIYLAGPLGFSEAGRVFQDLIAKHLDDAGYRAIDPFKLIPAEQTDWIAKLSIEMQKDAWTELNPRIAAKNCEALDGCDAVLAVLDGPDVDSGTAAEIGYAFARKKPIVGYRGDFRIAADNVGSTVNLQVEYFIRESGGTILARIDEVAAAITRIIYPELVSPVR